MFLKDGTFRDKIIPKPKLLGSRGDVIHQAPAEEESGPTYLYGPETFEDYSIGQTMLGTGNNQYTVRLATAGVSFDVVAGKWGRLADLTNWAGVTCNNSNLASATDYTIEFDIEDGLPRWIVTFRHTASGGYVLQHLPGSQLKLGTCSGWSLITGLTWIKDWSSIAPATATHCKIVLSGTSINVQITPGFNETHINASKTNGTIGFGGYSGDVEIDNIKVYL